MRRRVVAGMASFALVIGLVGCGQAETADQAASGQTEGLSEESLVSDWQVTTEEQSSLLTAEEEEVARGAGLMGQTDEAGWAYSAKVLLARATGDDGTPEHFGFLCQKRNGDDVRWTVVTVNEGQVDEDGHPMCFETEIDPANLMTTDTWEGVPGEDGWEVVGVAGEGAKDLSEDAQGAYEAAMATIESDPTERRLVLANIATQLVGGTNYLYVTETIPEDGIPRLSFLIAYENLEGTADVTLDSYIDLMAYLGW